MGATDKLMILIGYPSGEDGFDPGQEIFKKIACSRLTEFLLSWTKPAMGSQKAAEDSQNKEDINESHGFIAPQTQLSFFPGSSHYSFLIKRNFMLNYKSFIDQACSVKIA